MTYKWLLSAFQEKLKTKFCLGVSETNAEPFFCFSNTVIDIISWYVT